MAQGQGALGMMHLVYAKAVAGRSTGSLGIVNPDIAKFIEKRRDAALAFRAALTVETDRGCALFAAAYLDRALSDLLYVSVVLDNDIESDLFKGTAPLATFSARIKMCFYLGHISRNARRDLDIIRKVRNHFAHHAEVTSFEDKFVADRCRELAFSYHEKGQRSRAHFTAAVMGILAQAQIRALEVPGPEERPDNVPTDEAKAVALESAASAVRKFEEAMKRREKDGNA